MNDPYQTLGVAKTASQDEIKNAYRALAKKHHPDLNPGNKQAEARFKEINAAYEKVGTQESRAKFDQGEAQQNEQPQRGPFYHQTQAGPEHSRYSYAFDGGDAGAHFDERIFESLFRGQRAGGAARGSDFRGQDENYLMEIDLKDTIAGGEREINLPGGKRLSVKIPPGVMQGSRLRFAGQGGEGIGKGARGDVYVEIQVRPAPGFKTEGQNLTADLKVSFALAILGGEVRVPTLDGSVLMKIPPKSNGGAKLRLPGKGLFDRASGKRGDQIVSLVITLPEAIDAELEQAVRSWQERHKEASQ